MNKYYVNVKVDREERPDVDKVYMNFVQVAERIYFCSHFSIFLLLQFLPDRLSYSLFLHL